MTRASSARLPQWYSSPVSGSPLLVVGKAANACRSTRRPCAAARRSSSACCSTTAARAAEACSCRSCASSLVATEPRASASGAHCGQTAAAWFAASMSSRRSSAAGAAAAARSCAAPGAGGEKAWSPEARLVAGLLAKVEGTLATGVAGSWQRKLSVPGLCLAKVAGEDGEQPLQLPSLEPPHCPACSAASSGLSASGASSPLCPDASF